MLLRAEQGAMATQLQTPIFMDEDARVLDWRIEELLRAGFPELLALEIAATIEVDLHAALELRDRGCPAETAARILL
jgi:hypothetical protein